MSALTQEGYTDYKPTYDFQSAARRRLQIAEQNDAMETEYNNFRSQLKTNQDAFDENIRLRRANLDSLGVASRNVDSINQYGADLMGRVQSQFNYGSGTTNFNSGSGVSTPSGNFGSFVRAIAAKESGGNYSAVNRHSGALGKYQIMPANIPQWSRQALGRTISPSQFLASPKYQEQIAQYHLRRYYDQYGPAGASVAWYAGPAAANRFVASGYASRGMEANGYPSVYSYVNNIMAEMRRYG